ncbi:DDE-type integrase/transposase/recombinase, partial [Pseudomonas aeruginosa]
KSGPNQVVPLGPEHVWVADITYLPASSGPLYLSLVTDAYSRKIVGHHVHESLHAKSVAQAFRQALRKRQRRQSLV